MPHQDLLNLADVLDRSLTQSGHALAALSEQSPVLLLFLRHAGCTFCREALADLAKARDAISNTGTRIVLVHMGAVPPMEKLLRKNSLQDLDRIHDSAQRLYQAFGLSRGTIPQLFGPKVIKRGFQAGVLDGHGIGPLSGDGFQMPGLFLLNRGAIIRTFRHQLAADRPDYRTFCEQPPH